MLYHMVTGHPPFDGGDALEIAVKQMQEQPAPPSTVRVGDPERLGRSDPEGAAQGAPASVPIDERNEAGIEALGTRPAARALGASVRKPWYTLGPQ